MDPFKELLKDPFQGTPKVPRIFGNSHKVILTLNPYSNPLKEP